MIVKTSRRFLYSSTPGPQPQELPGLGVLGHHLYGVLARLAVLHVRHVLVEHEVGAGGERHRGRDVADDLRVTSGVRHEIVWFAAIFWVLCLNKRNQNVSARILAL